MIFASFRYTIALFFICIISCSTVRGPATRTIYSTIVKDSFELYIDLPQDYKKSKDYSIVFYMDANLKSGNELRRQIKLDSNKLKLSKVIFVGVGHIGDFHEKRRRDLIPFQVKGADTIFSKDPVYGQGERFYQFLTKELMPVINAEYPNNGKCTYIGHSFGGLFAFHCLMKPKPAFQNIIALSPSLWVNYSNAFRHEEFYAKAKFKVDGITLFHACGTAEWMNRVLYTSRDMRDILQRRNYPGINYIYKEFEGKNHNGVVPVALDYVISNIDL